MFNVALGKIDIIIGVPHRGTASTIVNANVQFD